MKSVIKATSITVMKLFTLFFTVISLFGCNAEDAFSVPSKSDDNSGKVLVSIQISPVTKLNFGRSDLQIAKGNKLPLVAIGTYSDGSSEDVTNKADWSSLEPLFVSVSSVGVTRGESEGQSRITASIGDIISNELIILVNPAEVVSIQITPPMKNIAVGSSQQYEARATYTDGTSAVINSNDKVEWFVSGGKKVSMAPTGVATAVETGNVEIFVMLGDVKSNVADLIVTDAVIMSIQIEPAVQDIPKGNKQQYTAIGTLSDKTTKDITNDVVWAVIGGDGVSISERGLATGNEVGTVNIEASIGEIKSNRASLEVKDAVVTALNITPLNTSIAKGNTQKYEAVATYSDGKKTDITSQVSWKSSDATIASIISGTANGVTVGQVNINASFNGINSEDAVLSVTAAEVVSLQVSPAVHSLAQGTSHQYTARATYTDDSFAVVTDSVSWLSSDSATATIVGGLATGVKVGQVTVTATLDSVVSNEAELTVTSAVLQSIQITPAIKSIAKGSIQQYEALGTYSDGKVQNISSLVSWSSSNTSFATISDKGIASGVAVGSSNIEAVLGSTTSNTAVLSVTAAEVVSIQVTPANASIAKGNSQQYTATATYTDDTTANITDSVSWFSSDALFASITSTGLVTGVSEGSVDVHATFGSIISNSVQLTVTAAELESLQITPPGASIAKGNTQQYLAIGSYSDGQNVDLTDVVTWVSSDPSLVTISSGVSGGLANGDREGEVKITAVYQLNTSNESTLTVTAAEVVSIQITPASANVVEGNTQQYLAMATYTDSSTADVTNSVSWTSSVSALATINTQGLATGVSVGEVRISAVKDEIASNNATLTVVSAAVVSIQVTPPTKSIVKGDTQKYVAVATYNNNTTKDVSDSVSWSSSDTVLATISSEGLATGVAEGGVTIKAALNGVTSNSASLTITSAVIRALQITPAVQSIPKGNQQQYTAVATYSDNSTQDVTARVSWNSSDRDIVTITNVGLAQGVIEGEVSITGSLNGITSNEAILTITTAVLERIELDPVSVSLAKGNSQQYIAMGFYSDDSQLDISNDVSWRSTVTSVATISNTGLVVGVNIGGSTVKASKDGIISNDSVVNITAAVLRSIELSPPNADITVSNNQQYIATGEYSDGSSRVISNDVSWMSNNINVATISQTGLAVGVKAGNTMIRAAKDSIISNGSELTVTGVALESIQITPSTITISDGDRQQYAAIGFYSDKTSRDITNEVSWSSGDAGVVTISSEGLVVGVWNGDTAITATKDGISGRASVTVERPFVAVSPRNQFVTTGDSLQLKAEVRYRDGRVIDITNQATWVSSDTQDIIVDQTGTVTAISSTDGAASRISATFRHNSVIWGETLVFVRAK
ncbi:beta strand repeat-containing protein [Aliivibrio fischeri]|uniref:beta strand repeat-containing protein n=1 Tax=Aliivibrio fischeri TaxID=668 RepID=UPI0007C45BCF|nr:Ig-like domain-containing protein [Aliivibrio fischeri]